MNREIKFRAWDKGKKVMYENVNIIPQTDGNTILVSPNGYNIQSQNGDVAIVETEFVFCTVAIMQFTGLLDKNGKEAFEGDIVKYVSVTEYEGDGDVESTIRKNEYQGVVEFKYGKWMINCTDFYTVCTSLHSYEDVEIIGNIYENPELLEEAQ